MNHNCGILSACGPNEDCSIELLTFFKTPDRVFELNKYMNDENSLNIGFFTILLVIGVGLVPFGIGIFIILYAFGYLFHSLFGKK